MSPVRLLRAGTCFGAFATAALGVAACHVGRVAGPDGPTTYSVEYLAYNIERHKGQTIRICGTLVEEQGQWRIEQEPSAALGTHHGRPVVLVAACVGETPRLDSQGCMSGQVARRDGSLAPPSGPATIDDVPTNYDWFLHPQCRTGR